MSLGYLNEVTKVLYCTENKHCKMSIILGKKHGYLGMDIY